jgi:hypothetical protein
LVKISPCRSTDPPNHGLRALRYGSMEPATRTPISAATLRVSPAGLPSKHLGERKGWRFSADGVTNPSRAARSVLVWRGLYSLKSPASLGAVAAHHGHDPSGCRPGRRRRRARDGRFVKRRFVPGRSYSNRGSCTHLARTVAGRERRNRLYLIHVRFHRSSEGRSDRVPLRFFFPRHDG